jgi:hypothetical protein
MQATFSDTLIFIYQTTRYHTSEDHNINVYRASNLNIIDHNINVAKQSGSIALDSATLRQLTSVQLQS